MQQSLLVLLLPLSPQVTDEGGRIQSAQVDATSSVAALPCHLPIEGKAFAHSGKTIVIAVPLPGSLCSSTRALWNCAPCLTMDRPRPVPPTSLLWLLSTR